MGRKKISAAQKAARKYIGDGKLPNKYFVVISNHWTVIVGKGKDATGESSSQVYSGLYKEQFETFGPFKTYKEAYAVLNEQIIDFVEPSEDGFCSGYIEDRISGEVASYECLQWTKERRGIFKVPSFNFELREDYGFTKKTIEAAGKVFE